MTRRWLAVALCSAMLSAGCFEFFNQTNTNPNPTIQFLGGTWTSSTSNGAALLNSCTNFKWIVTEQTSATVAGNFTATCFGVLQVAGNAHGTISGNTINWTAAALANGGGVSNCAVTLNGSMTIASDQISVPYTGTTCLGPVSGTEILRKS